MNARTYTFPTCWVNTDGDWTETVFHDGTRVTALPNGDLASLSHALELGYDGSSAAAQMSREHELLHTFLADRLRDGGASPTLWAVAHNQTGNVAPVWEQEIEEGLVLAFQRFLNGMDGGPEVMELAQQGVDADALRRDALHLLRAGEHEG